MNAANLDLTAVKCTPIELTLTWHNSTYSVYSSLWLRDNDPAHRDPRTGQRRISLLDLPPDPRLVAAERRPPGHITLIWEGGETSVFPLSWLCAFDRSLRTGSRPTRLPWMGQPAQAFACCDYLQWVENPASRRDWLYYVGRDGLAFLSGAPIEEGARDAALLRVAALIGFVRETNFGRLFHVPGNLAQSHPRLPLHTSGPYRDPVPGFLLLHCLSLVGQGGESLFVDGMALAERVRAHDNELFSTLSQIPILYRFQDTAVDLVAERTMLEVDTQGQFRAIHYDDGAIAPLPLRGPRLKKYYAAYRQLTELLHEQARPVVRRLQPGDLVLIDNTRILHGHRVIDGIQHLQGCYIDADGLYSSLAVLDANPL